MKKKQNLQILAIVLAAAILVFAGLFAFMRFNPTKTNDAYLPKAESASSTTPPSNPQSDSSAIKSEQSQQSTTPISIPTSDAPAKSSSGSVTISNPKQGNSITSGSQVAGLSSHSQVYFRLKGSKSGQLASGTVSTSNGQYSFELSFTNQVVDGSDTGVLEVYSETSNGQETDNATVAVNING